MPSNSSNRKTRTYGPSFASLLFPYFIIFFIDGVVASICVIQNFPHCDGSIVVFDGFWFKNILTQIFSCSIVFNYENNLARPLLTLNGTFMFEYYKEFTLVLNQKIDNDFIKKIQLIVVNITRSIAAQCS